MEQGHDSPRLVVDRSGIDALLSALRARGYVTVGPTVRDQAIVYDEISTTADLPVGWTDEQDAAGYRLVPRDDDSLFGYVVGPHSWKSYLFPSDSPLFSVEKSNGTIRFVPPPDEPPVRAFIGVRACELSAIAIQDSVFLDSGHVDRTYAIRRNRSLLVAVNCGEAGGTCFCVSMETGPACRSGYDLALTEMRDGDRHEFLVESGSAAGREVLDDLEGRRAHADDIARARAVVATAERHMGRHLDTEGIHDLLLDNLEHPHWSQVAERCLSCANCTLACPTCFCSTTGDVAGLDDAAPVRTRRWDSCFSLDFSALHQHPLRNSTRSRYRQWMTHKLATWIDQFGTSGCVGCGRCITWCPVGIDLTREVAALRQTVKIPLEVTP